MERIVPTCILTQVDGVSIRVGSSSISVHLSITASSSTYVTLIQSNIESARSVQSEIHNMF